MGSERVWGLRGSGVSVEGLIACRLVDIHVYNICTYTYRV